MKSFVLLASINPERRAYLEIVASMLDACRCSTRKTRVMSQCNMSFYQFGSYWNVLLKANLLLAENDGQPGLFRVTDKGKDFLKAYNELISMLE